MHQKIIISFLFVYTLAITLYAQPEPATATISSNNIKAQLTSNGLLFFGEEKGFEFPIGSNTHLMKSSGLWIAGYDLQGNLRGAIQKYNEDGKRDFVNEENWNKIWRITKKEIDDFREDYMTNGLDEAHPAIFGWPAKGNDFFFDENGFDMPEGDEEYAPFVDINENRIYEPDRGEYPNIGIRCVNLPAPTPDEMLWCRYTDNTEHTESGMLPINLEVHTSYFVFNCVNNQFLNNTIFVRHWLINKVDGILDDAYIGVFSDFDIGCPDDDYMGASNEFRTIYGYNADNDDTSCTGGEGYGQGAPAIATTMLMGPWTLLNNAVVFINFNRHMPIPYGDGNEGEPFIGQDYYNYLDGRWKDGSDMPFGGVFYDGNPSSSPNTELALGNPQGDRRALGSVGPFIFRGGGRYELVLAYSVYDEPGNSNLGNVNSMYQGISYLRSEFSDCYANCLQQTTPVDQVQEEIEVSIYPNPNSGVFNIVHEDSVQAIFIYSSDKKLVQKIVTDKTAQTQTVTLTSGLYFVKLETEKGVLIEKVVVY